MVMVMRCFGESEGKDILLILTVGKRNYHAFILILDQFKLKCDSIINQQSPSKMTNKRIIKTEQAAAPVGPYNQAIAATGELIFVSGQVALDAKTGSLIGDGDIVAQTQQVMANIKAILSEADLGWENVVKTTIYLTDLSNFSTVNEVYGSYFDPETAPARACIEVSGLPKGALVEVECLAVNNP